MINDDIAARIAAKADRDELVDACWQCAPEVAERPRDEAPTLPWLRPATVDPDWLTEARNHSAATREPFTHPLWDVSAA